MTSEGYRSDYELRKTPYSFPFFSVLWRASSSYNDVRLHVSIFTRAAHLDKILTFIDYNQPPPMLDEMFEPAVTWLLET